MYAAQTYSNIPASDGRRIQIGWGRISHDGMPFNGMMLLPNELTLRTTSKGVRLFSVPVRETEQLFQPVGNWTSLSSDAANNAYRRSPVRIVCGSEQLSNCHMLPVPD